MQIFKRIFHKKTQLYPHLNAYYPNSSKSLTNYKDESDDDDAPSEISKDESIENSYGDSILAYTIMRDEALQCFYVVNDLHIIYNMLTTGIPKSIHEVVISGMPQKLRFDVDVPSDDITNIHNEELFATHDEVDPYTNNKYREFMYKYTYSAEDQLRLGINQTFKDSRWSPAFIRAEFCVMQLILTIISIIGDVPIIKCTSHGTNKFSYHIIINAAAENHEAAHYYSMKIYNAIPASYIRRYIDLGVYKSVQNLRVAYSYKHGADKSMARQKIISPIPLDTEDNYYNWKMSLISYIDNTTVILPSVLRNIKHSPYEQPSEYTSVATLPIGFLQIIEPYSAGLIPEDVNGNLVRFQRIEPSHCKICDRIHDNDNSLMIIIHKDCYILKCRRNAFKQKIIINITSVVLPKTTKGPRRSDTFINIQS